MPASQPALAGCPPFAGPPGACNKESMVPHQPPSRSGELPRSDGLQALFDRHRAEILRFLAARCGNAEEAQDLLQDLWLKLARSAPGPVRNGRAYLFRMANNLVLDKARGARRAMRRDRAWLDADGPVPDLPEHRPDPADNAEETLARQQEVEALREAIDSLPPGQRRALWLYRIEEHNQAVVAAIMGISRSGVEKHLALAMRHLRERLGAAGLFLPARPTAGKEQER